MPARGVGVRGGEQQLHGRHCPPGSRPSPRAHPGAAACGIVDRGPDRGFPYARNRRTAGGCRRRWWPSSTTTNGSTRGFCAPISNSSKPVPGPSWPGGASSPNTPRDVRRGCRNTPNCLIANPMDFGHAGASVPGGTRSRGRQHGFPPLRGRPDTAGSTPRWGAWNGDVDRRRGERLLRTSSCSAARRCWYVPGAVMWHIIPPGETHRGLISAALSYNVGVSQRLRAGIYRRLSEGRSCWRSYEVGGYARCFRCTMSPRKSLWLIRMRYEISRGLFSRAGH